MLLDIVTTVPWHCGDKDCPDGWHLSNYWIQEDGSYTVDSYSDGDHEDIDEEEMPSFEEQDQSWLRYYRDCIETGEDVLGEFARVEAAVVVVVERWQFIISNSILGPVLSRCRRARSNGKGIYGRGEWIWGGQAPRHLTEYLLLNPDGRGSSEVEYPTFDEYIEVLRSCDDVIEQSRGRWVATTTRNENRAPSVTYVRKRAREATKQIERRCR